MILILLEYEEIESEFKDLKWVIFNNDVIDITKLTHPGGQFIWEDVAGREISRFIYGAYGLETTKIPAY